MSFRNSPPRQPAEPPAHRHPRLTLSPGLLARQINERIERGQSLRQALGGSADDLKDRRNEYYSWIEYNQELLRRSFDQPGPADEYSRVNPIFVGGNETLQMQWDDLGNDIADHIRRLQSLRDRLDLFDVVTAHQPAPAERSAGGQDVFVVHGHDGTTKTMVARFLHQLTGAEPVILHERPDGGRTVIEKFEAHADDAAAAVVLLTGDDVGGTRTGGGTTGSDVGPQQPRARQNVVLELGFFLGRLGRKNVVILYEPGVELPSDLSGVIWIKLDTGGAWRNLVARELQEVGVDVDLNALLRT